MPSNDEPTPAIDEMTYEQAVDALETIIDRIESGEIGLEESITAYERGLALKKRCEDILSQAEQRIEHLGGQAPREAQPDQDEPDG